MPMAPIPKSKGRKGQRQIWGNKNWQGRGEREEASTLLISGFPAAFSKSMEQTEASTILFLVFINVQTPGQDFGGHCQSRFKGQNKIQPTQMLAKGPIRSLPEICG